MYVYASRKNLLLQVVTLFLFSYTQAKYYRDISEFDLYSSIEIRYYGVSGVT